MNFETMIRSSFEFISAASINDIICRLSKEINEELSDKKNIIVVPLLHGGSVLSTRLQEHFTFPYTMGYIHTQLYEKGNKNSGRVIVKNKHLPYDMLKNTVLLIDDIFDSGKTMAYANNLLKSFWNVPHLYSVVLLEKDNERTEEINKYRPNFVGKIISRDVFVFGMGMDYDGYWRGLNSVRVMF